MESAERARSFDAEATAYELGRPEYPQAALDWWADRGGLPRDAPVLDLAAGTGKLTRLLRARGVNVVAVEPLPNMRRQFVLAVPGATVLDGTAESIPLGDDSMGAVFAGQAFHWFDPQPAIAEIRRVLRPGGGLGLIWNDDDRSNDWVDRLSALKREESPAPASSAPPVDVLDGPFDVEHVDIPWTTTTTTERLLANIRSRSYFASMPEEKREAAMAPFRAVLDELSPVGSGESIAHPLIARVYWCTPR